MVHLIDYHQVEAPRARAGPRLHRGVGTSNGHAQHVGEPSLRVDPVELDRVDDLPTRRQTAYGGRTIRRLLVTSAYRPSGGAG